MNESAKSSNGVQLDRNRGSCLSKEQTSKSTDIMRSFGTIRMVCRVSHRVIISVMA